MIEEWREIKNYEGLYQVSNNGEIFSNYTKKLLNPRTNKKNGYKQTFLCKNGIKTMYYVHRIVAETFIPAKSKKEIYINHKNEIKTDNRVENLEWCTKSYNNSYNDKHQRSSKPIIQLDKNGAMIKWWRSAREVNRMLGLSYKNISAVIRGLRKTCGGFIWKYAERSGEICQKQFV